MMKRIGFLGTGIMGAHMARRLAAAGFEVAAWNRSIARAQPLAAHGVRIAADVDAALKGAEAVVVMLSTGAVIDETLFGGGRGGSDASASAALDSLAPGSLLIVMSSIPVPSARAQADRASDRGLLYLDAPVSGGEPGARDGSLAIMVGGSSAAFEAARPVFAALGRPTLLGPVGSGQLAKLCNQVIVGGTLVAIAEALTLAASGGADPAAVRVALMGGFGDSKVLRVLGERMVSGDFEPGSPAGYQLKDLRTASALAGDAGLRLPLLQHLVETFASLAAHGDGERDVSIVMREIQRRAIAATAASKEPST
jgi:2-hydroxy-3-oxopropionate reductase